MWNILHTITSLDVGGAQIMLQRLLGATDRGRFAPTVLSMMPSGVVAPPIAGLAIDVHSLGMRRGYPGPASLARLRRVARSAEPDLIQSWMYHGNIAGTLAWAWRRCCPCLVWSVHHSLVDLDRERPMTRALVRLSARLSRLPQAIVYCSKTSADQHEALGFEPARRVIIPNGIDTAQFRPDPAGRDRLVDLLGTADGLPLVGIVARTHPMKDHPNLIRAAARLRAAGIDLRLVLLGHGADSGNAALGVAVRSAGMSDRVHLLGERADVAHLVPGLDLVVSASAWGEAFPLAIGEAMACAVPCVVTDIGDCAWLVGDTGAVVPPRDSVALANAMQAILAMPPESRRALGIQARARIEENFGLEPVVRRYEELYDDLLRRQAATGRRRSGRRHGRGQ